MSLKNRFKKFKNVCGVSLLEIVLALGIMAVITPVVMKLVFKDLSDVKYLNISKQLKQFIKSLSAYASTKREDWAVNSFGNITKANFASYGLEDTVDSQILDNVSIRYTKDADSKVVVYAVINMNSFPLDAVSFKKTLMFVGDNIGYTLSDSCGSCTTKSCVCGINGDWGATYAEVTGGEGTFSDSDLIAVVRIDDTLIENEYSSSLFLYRNSQGGTSGNVMGRDLSLGGHDIKNIKDIYVNNLFGKNESTPLITLNADNGEFDGSVSILNAIIFDDEAELEFSDGAFVFAPEINFLADTYLYEFSAPNATLARAPSSNSYASKIDVDRSVKLGTLQVQNLSFSSLTNSGLVINDNETSSSASSFIVSSQLKVDVPNLSIGNLRTKVLTVNNYPIYSNLGTASFSSSGGVMSYSTVPTVVVNNIPGSSAGVNIFTKISEFSEAVGTLTTSIKQRMAASGN